MSSNRKPAQQLFDLLVTKGFDPELLDSSGKPSPSPDETEVFSFDFTPESGKDYGTVVIMLGDESELQVYFGDNLGKGMEGEDKTAWFNFLSELKRFATKNLMSFSPKNLNKLKYAMQSQAAIKEGLFENWMGNRIQSWSGEPTQARLMIKHKRPLGENDARFRYIESLFIETAEGERYKLPFTKLAGGRAMVEHVRNGGQVWDVRGQHISEIVEELGVLSRFRRASQNKVFEGDTAALVEQTNAYYESAQHTLKSLSTTRGYTTYFESWKPAAVTEEEIVIEGLKHLFVTQSIDTRIEDALPILARIQQEQVMKEANIFEAWVDNLAEGTWALPDDKQKQAKLVELLSKPLPVGPDATNATEQLYDLLGDDELFNQLELLAKDYPDADCRQVIRDRMQQLSDPSVQAVLAQLQVEPSATMNPAPEVDPATVSPDAPEQEVKETFNDDLEKIIALARNKKHEPSPELHKGDEHEINSDRDNVGVDQLDELSKDTLKSYIKKAGSSSDERSASNLASRAAHKLSNPEGDDDGNWDDEKSYMRSKGIARAVDKLEEGQSIADYKAKIAAMPDAEVKMLLSVMVGHNRDNPWDQGIIKLLKRELDNRSQEQVNELSPNTLKSYAKDAALDNARRGNTLGYLRGKPTKSGALEKDIGDKIARRQQGISKAIDRLEEGGAADADAVRELVLTAYNNNDLYRQSYAPIIQNLQKKVAKGIYDTEAAKKLWGYHADRAAQAYAKEFGGEWNKMFTPATRRAAAEQFEQEAREEIGADQVDEASDTVKFDPKTGKPTAWSHEGDWKKTPKRNGKPVDPRGEVTNMAGKELQRAKKVADLDEGKMSEVDELMQEICNGTVDMYQVYSKPATPVEKYASQVIHNLIDQAVEDSDYRLHPKDDFEQLEKIAFDKLCDKYGEKEMNEIKDPRTQTEDPANTQEPEYGPYGEDLAAILKSAGVDDAERAAPDYEAPIQEAASRRDFRTVADLIKQIPDEAKKRELADHHAKIFAQMNPRFNHETWNKYLGLDEAYDSPLDTPAAKAAREQLQKAMAPEKAKNPNHPALRNFKEDEVMEESEMCNMTEADEHCPIHGTNECWGSTVKEGTALQGQYGHSGKMQPVAEAPEFLTRLKELSGMMRSDKI